MQVFKFPRVDHSFNMHAKMNVVRTKWMIPRGYIWQHLWTTAFDEADIYLFKVNNRNTRKRFEICSKLTTKTAEPTTWKVSVFGVFLFRIFSHSDWTHPVTMSLKYEVNKWHPHELWHIMWMFFLSFQFQSSVQWVLEKSIHPSKQTYFSHNYARTKKLHLMWCMKFKISFPF